jgi:hypothetical protein
MNCPKCNRRNPDDAQICTSCSAVLNPASTTERIFPKNSGLATASLILAILCPFTCGITAIPAMICGIISLILIDKSGGKITGRGFAIIGIVSPVIALFVIFVLFYLADNSKKIHPKVVCATNLSGIGRAMLVYNSDYEDLLPQAGGPGTIWQTKINNWRAKDRITAFNLNPDDTGGAATISSSLYLLVKYSEMSPKSFCCPADRKTKPFKASDYTSGMDDEDAWDFGPEPSKHCSYSYHMCYGSYPLSFATSQSGMAIAADRNPWLDPSADTTGFKWDDNTKTTGSENIKGYQKGNAGHHKREGQNVLFVDAHVAFEKRPCCGVNDDNIYTYWNGPIIQQGAPPVIGSQPADKLDSLLVNEPPPDKK